jgi:hypothetical protein
MVVSVGVGKELAAIEAMTVAELREKYAEVFGDATTAGNKDWLRKRIAWRVQAIAEGDLSQRARERAAELANDADARVSAPKASKPRQVIAVGPNQRVTALPQSQRLPPPGSIITREYKGRTIQVRILASGFEHDGVTYKSLSAVAKAITGSHCNGFHFFRLTNGGK